MNSDLSMLDIFAYLKAKLEAMTGGLRAHYYEQSKAKTPPPRVSTDESFEIERPIQRDSIHLGMRKRVAAATVVGASRTAATWVHRGSTESV
jgi:hypothetical protein